MSTTGWVPFLGLQVKSLVPGTFVPGFFIANLIAEVQLGILGPLNIRGDSVGAVRRGNPAWMFGSDVGRWAGEGGGRRAHGDHHCGKEGCE